MPLEYRRITSADFPICLAAGRQYFVVMASTASAT